MWGIPRVEFFYALFKPIVLEMTTTTTTTTIELIEDIDVRKVRYVKSLSSITDDEDADKQVKGYLTKYLTGHKKNRCFKSTYLPGKEYGNYGRLYPNIKYNNGNACTGLAMFHHQVRSYLASETYIDVDMKRAHWYLLKHVLSVHRIPSPIDEVLNDYDKMAELAGKQTLLSMINKERLNEEHREVCERFPAVKKLHDIMYTLLYACLREKHQELFKLVEKANKKKGKDYNLKGSFMAHVLQEYEKRVITTVYELFTQQDIVVGAIVFDGILVARKSVSSEEHLQRVITSIEEHLAAKFQDLECHLVVKPWPEWPEEWRTETETPQSAYGMMTQYLLQYISAMDLRFDGERVFARDQTHPMRWRVMYTDYRDLIVNVFKDHSLYNDTATAFQQIMGFLRERRHILVQALPSHLEWIAFKNGALNIIEHKFTPLDAIPRQTEIVARHYIDADFDVNNFDTPLFDSMLEYQLNDPEAVKWFYIFMVRMLFPPGVYDSFQVAPYICGLANTGKSTVSNISTAMFNPAKVGNLNSSHEKTFGLDNFLDKEAIWSHDTPENLKDTLDCDLLKQMVSGEMLSVSRKFQKAASVKWDKPIWFASNFMPNYDDANGAMSKRFAIFRFDKVVQKSDSSLEHRIKTEELATIINKGLKYYHEVRHAKRTFDDMRSVYFQQTKEEYIESVCTFYEFMNQPHFTDKNNFVHCTVIEPENHDIYELMPNIQAKYQMYCKVKGVKPTWKRSDHSVFNKFKLEVKNMHICKSCAKIARKGCCDSYNHNNRVKQYVVFGIKYERN